MQYQLVLQFPATTVDEWDELIAFEETLTHLFGESASVDGHDFGSGEFNLFILTDHPKAVFQQSRKALEKSQPTRSFKAAYRNLDVEDYVTLWPKGLKEFKVA